MRSSLTLITLLMLLLLWSCGRSGGNSAEVWQTERDNIEEVEVISIVDSLPDMHNMTYSVGLLGDTLIFKDFQSTDRIFASYNVATGEFLGWFGKYGNGPGELANVGGTFIDKKNKIFYGLNANQWSYFGIKIDEALGNPDYDAVTKSKIITDDKKMPFMQGYYFNDSTVIVAGLVPNKEWTSLTFHLGNLNLKTGDITLIDHPAVEDRAQYHIGVSERNNLIVASGVDVDRLILFDLKGNIKKNIYGPKYEPEVKKKKDFFKVPVVTDDKIYIIYRKDGHRRKRGKEILELDIEGNYIRTLKAPIELVDIEYHKGTNRLYFSSVEDPQFGYIQL